VTRNTETALVGRARVHAARGWTAMPRHVVVATSLPDADYADLFSLPARVDATAEQCARAMFGDVPDAAERLIWRGLLGMRLGRGRSATTVAGWCIGAHGENWIRLEARSWFLTGNLVIRVTTDQISLATLVRYDRVLGRLIWPALSVLHRRMTPGLLRDAAKALGP
jgi:hypothetical protein